MNASAHTSTQQRTQLLDIVSNYRTHVSKTLWRITLLAWLMSFGFATVHGTWLLALFVGGALTAINTFLVFKASYRVASMGVAISLMVFVSLHVHQLHGMIEAHFGYFIFIAALFSYLNWRPIVTAAVTAAALHVGVHILQGMGYPIYLFPEEHHSWSIVALHAFYVVVESAVLIYLTSLTYHLLSVSRELLGVLNKVQQKDQLDLAAQVEKTQNNPILIMLNAMLSSVNSAIAQAKSAEKTTSNILHNVNQDIVNLVDYAQSNHKEAEQMQHELADLSELSSAVRHNIEETVTLIEQAAEKQRLGGQAIMQSHASLAQLAHSLQETSGQIDSLAEDCNAAMGILSGVEAIAEQTNLLALNAAIEAARAGDQGRGFAVVADEVRALATRSQDSTQRISDILHRLQATSQSSVGVMRDSAEQAQQNVTSVQETVSIFNETGTALSKMIQLGEQIGQSAIEQEHASSTLMTQALQVRSVASDSEAAVGRVRESIEQLAQDYGHLKQGLSVFKAH